MVLTPTLTPGDYGFNNPAKSRDTPHLDALRAEGMRCTDLHA